MTTHPQIETFPALSEIPGLIHGFFLRTPDIDVDVDRELALERLAPYHASLLSELGLSAEQTATGEQVHGKTIAVVDGSSPRSEHFPETDGLVTGTPGQTIGVWVADCGAAFLVDPVHRACGIVHSGKIGTELSIIREAISQMEQHYQSDPAQLIVQLAPCIRPPAYEVDFAAQIIADAIAAGVPAAQIHDCGTCTSQDLERYYSYRVEMGKTGRMFAVIAWPQE